MSNNLLKMDKWILAIVLFLMGMGIVFIYSSSFAIADSRFGGASFFAIKQAQRAIIALLFLFVFSKIDYHIIARPTSLYFLASIVVLIAVFSFKAHNGSHRWISIFGIGLQASELARIGLVMVLSRQLSTMATDGSIKDPFGFSVVMAEIGIIVALIAKEPDFSSSMLVTALAFAMVIAAGAKFKHLVIASAGALFSAFIYMRSAEYRWARVLAFLHPEEHAQGSAFQSNQALLAIGNGRFFGVGLGMSEQKNFYVPEPHTDFIFSVLSEELGFIGMATLTAVFIVLIYRGFRVAKYAPDALGKMLAFGLTLLIAANFVAHTGVNLGLFPTTGIPLPFISYGGMSLIFTTTSIAILLNISSQTNFKAVKK